MELIIQIVYAKDFIRVVPNGVLNPESTGEMLLASVTIAVPAQDYNILFDCRTAAVQMTLADVTAIVKVALDRRDLFRRKMAFLLPKEEIEYKLLKFMEVYATNRGIRIQVFDSFEDAFSWLMPSPAIITPDEDNQNGAIGSNDDR